METDSENGDQVHDAKDCHVTVTELKERLRWTQQALTRARQQLAYMQHQKRGPWADLPGDILMLIFEDVLLPAVFLDPSIVLGPGSAWCEDMRMRKSLTLICRNWGRFAKHYLYRDIILRRVGQVVLLSRTLHLFKLEIAPLIRSISFSFYVPTHLRALASRSVAHVLEKCDRIISVEFAPHFFNYYIRRGVFSLSEDDELFIRNFRSLAPKLKVLRHSSLPLDNVQSSEPTMTYPLRLLALFSNLRSLVIPIQGTKWIEDHHPLRFEQLEELSVVAKEDDDSHLRIISSWYLPLLNRISVLIQSPGLLDAHNFQESLAFLISIHGSRIMEFEIISDSYEGFRSKLGDPLDLVVSGGKPMSVAMERIIDSCPSLRYLACCPWLTSKTFESLYSRSPSVQVDLWCTMLCCPLRPHDLTPYPNVRLIDIDFLLQPRLPRLLLRPLDHEATGPPAIVHHAYRNTFVQTSFAIYPLECWAWTTVIMSETIGHCFVLPRWITGQSEWNVGERLNYAVIKTFAHGQRAGDVAGLDDTLGDIAPGEDELPLYETESTDLDDDGDYQPPSDEEDYVTESDFSDDGKSEDFSDYEGGDLNEEDVQAAYSYNVNRFIGGVAYKPLVYPQT